MEVISQDFKAVFYFWILFLLVMEGSAHLPHDEQKNSRCDKRVCEIETGPFPNADKVDNIAMCQTIN